MKSKSQFNQWLLVVDSLVVYYTTTYEKHNLKTNAFGIWDIHQKAQPKEHTKQTKKQPNFTDS